MNLLYCRAWPTPGQAREDTAHKGPAKIIKQALLLLLLPASALCNAAQFESVIDAMAIQASATHTNNGWEDMAKIKGVKWRWPYYQSGAHDASMVGKTKVGHDKNPHIGATTVTVHGARTMVTTIKINIANASADMAAFGTGKASKITTSCDQDAASDKVAFYRFNKPGYKPLYVSRQESRGAGGSGGVAFEVAYALEDVLNIHPTPCAVVK